LISSDVEYSTSSLLVEERLLGGDENKNCRVRAFKLATLESPLGLSICGDRAMSDKANALFERIVQGARDQAGMYSLNWRLGLFGQCSRRCIARRWLQ